MFISDETREILGRLMELPQVSRVETGKLPKADDDWVEIDFELWRMIRGSLGSFSGSGQTTAKFRFTDGYAFLFFVSCLFRSIEFTRELSENMDSYLDETYEKRKVIRCGSTEEYEKAGSPSTQKEWAQTVEQDSILEEYVPDHKTLGKKRS